MKKWIKIVIVLAISIGVAIGVFVLGNNKNGALPNLPILEINQNDLKIAKSSLKKRAKKVTIGEYERDVLDAFFDVNRAEAGEKASEKINLLIKNFENKNLIANTAKKERYILLGDYAAVQFEIAFNAFLLEAQKTNLRKAISQKSKSYKMLIKFSGSFLSKIISMNLLTDKGIFLADENIPQIMFRRRWRMLGGLPYYYHLFKVELLIDKYFILKNSDKKLIDLRLDKLKQIEKIQPQFDTLISKALIFYDGGDKKSALMLLKAAPDDRKKDFSVTQFIKYLENID